MSQENVELVRSVVEPFGGIDVTAIDLDAAALRETFGRAYSPDFELRTLASGTYTGISRVFRGWDGLVRYLGEWLEPFSEYYVEPLDYIEAGDHIVVPTRQRGVGRQSGAPAELEITWVYEIRDGQIARAYQYDTLEEAREAVELRE